VSGALAISVDPAVVDTADDSKNVTFAYVWAGNDSTFAIAKSSTDIYACGLNNRFQLGEHQLLGYFM
jgi:alpha-tubulin suppressor-like RCC1 family protein